jgi:hypothetical protein
MGNAGAHCQLAERGYVLRPAASIVPGGIYCQGEVLIVRAQLDAAAYLAREPIEVRRSCQAGDPDVPGCVVSRYVDHAGSDTIVHYPAEYFDTIGDEA